MTLVTCVAEFIDANRFTQNRAPDQLLQQHQRIVQHQQSYHNQPAGGSSPSADSTCSQKSGSSHSSGVYVQQQQPQQHNTEQQQQQPQTSQHTNQHNSPPSGFQNSLNSVSNSSRVLHHQQSMDYTTGNLDGKIILGDVYIIVDRLMNFTRHVHDLTTQKYLS